MRRFKRILVVAVVTSAIAAVVWWVFTSQIKASIGYRLHVDIEVLLGSDQALVDWIATQPGVVKAFCNRDSEGIEIVWIMVQNLRREPPLPGIRMRLELLNYKGIGEFKYN